MHSDNKLVDHPSRETVAVRQGTGPRFGSPNREIRTLIYGSAATSIFC